MPLIKYIGQKDRKEDNVANTGTVWLGNGDIQSVPLKAVAPLLAHPDVWEEVEGDDTSGEGQGLVGKGRKKGAKAPAPAPAPGAGEGDDTSGEGQGGTGTGADGAGAGTGESTQA